METKILVIGDVYGRPGRHAIREGLKDIQDEYGVDYTIINGENAAGGKGMTEEICSDFFNWGADVISSGNHVRAKKEIDQVLKTNPAVLRPYNYPEKVPGVGIHVGKARNHQAVATINILGRVHMADVACPFTKAMEAIKEAKKQANIVMVDFHAEATSEKRAMGWFLNGKVSAVVGTHTHVPTADAEILPNKTAYITDLGMTGPYNSVIGLKTELALERFLNNNRKKFEVAKGDVRLCGAVITVEDSGEAIAIEQVIHKIELNDK
ncbi:TIGR00282 family metallophosphoesterase [bacterium]|nr:TIGR00282 family metallophosphoesterase [bacterium]